MIITLGGIVASAIGFIGYQFLDEQLFQSLLSCSTLEIRSYLAGGLNPNRRIYRRAWEDSGTLPLFVAATCKDPEPIKALIAAGADVNARDGKNWTG